MKECLYVVLLKGRELRQWLIYFLSHTAASNHCSMELLTHPSIMLSRHIICVCFCCVRLCESVAVWFLGALKAGVGNVRVDILMHARVHICVSQDLKCVCACVCVCLCVRAPSTLDIQMQHVFPCSPWLHLTLSTSGGHTLMCEHGPLRSDLRGRWSSLCSDEATKTQTHTGFLLDVGSGCTSCFCAANIRRWKSLWFEFNVWMSVFNFILNCGWFRKEGRWMSSSSLMRCWFLWRTFHHQWRLWRETLSLYWYKLIGWHWKHVDRFDDK